MKRGRNLVIAFVCLISGLFSAMVTFYGNKDLTREDTTAVAYRQDGKQIQKSRTQTQTERTQSDGLPESEQIPGDEDLRKLNNTTLLKIYWKYINMLQILCKDVIRVGSFLDGGKEICIDQGYKPQAPCLVYSFGINHQFDFDLEVVERFGCDVYCFDPSMANETRRLSEHIWFYRWGLGGKNKINFKQWHMKTLNKIRSELGHTNRTLNLLKIDIEGGEWTAIPQMITSGALDDVRQISMETHFSAEHADRGDFWGNVPPLKQLSALRQLYDFGYRTFMRERNMGSHSKWRGINGFITNVNEISMIKPKV